MAISALQISIMVSRRGYAASSAKAHAAIYKYRNGVKTSLLIGNNQRARQLQPAGVSARKRIGASAKMSLVRSWLGGSSWPAAKAEPAA